MRILGIDPGLAIVGYAVLEINKREKKLLTVGVVRTKANIDIGERLIEIQKDLREIIRSYKPSHASVEQLFFSKNVSTGIPVAEARGVIMLTLKEEGLSVYEFGPGQVKQALTGDGRADKKAIQKMVSLELGLKSVPKPDDAADALSLALTLASQLR